MCIRDRLDPVYAICWLDAIHYKVKDDKGRAVTRAIYNVLGINNEILGMGSTTASIAAMIATMVNLFK